MKLVASIVLYRPDLGLLARTLASLDGAVAQARAQGSLGEAVLVLVDNSPQPLAATEQEACRQAVPHLALHYDFTGGNLGFGRANNRAFAAQGHGSDFFLVANPDLEFFGDSLSRGLAALRARPDKGLLAASLVEQRDGAVPACFRYPDCVTLLLRLLFPGRFAARSRRYQCRDWNREAAADPVIVSGCCMLFRSPAFARLEGFDPGYFLYFEDFDLSYRAGLAGLSLYAPGLRVRHHGGGAGRKGLRHIAWFAASAWRFFQRHGWRFLASGKEA